MGLAAIAGELPAAQLLLRSLERNRLAHAYLFAGDEAPALEALATAMAKIVNCPHPRTLQAAIGQDSCDQCPHCVRIHQGVHPDVLWVRPESKTRLITIEQVREVIRVLALKPTEARWKVAVLAGADRMNPQASNALLKTLEEPPANSILLLLSTQPHQLLETILSRCLRLTFNQTNRRQLASSTRDWLQEFVTQLAKPSASRLGRYAVLGSLLSQLNESRRRIEEDLTARSRATLHPEAEPSLREKWEAELAAAVEAEYRRQRSEILNWLQWFFRDVWLVTLANHQELVQLPELKPSIQAMAARMTTGQALANLRSLDQAVRLLETNAQEALVLEVSLLKLQT